MFVRPKKNKSGSINIQIISKSLGKCKVVRILGSATTQQEIERLTRLAEQEIERLSEPLSLFSSENDILVEKVFESLHNLSIQTVGPELVFGKIFDYIGFNQIGEDLSRHLVISRLTFPLSKLKTIEYLNMYQITYTLPDSKHTKTSLLAMDKNQNELFNIVSKYF